MRGPYQSASAHFVASVAALAASGWSDELPGRIRTRWESAPFHGAQDFKDYLRDARAAAIDMETATIFTVGFVNRIPRGALLLVSDLPMVPEGVKTAESDQSVTENYVSLHLDIGVHAVLELAESGDSVKHLRF